MFFNNYFQDVSASFGPKIWYDEKNTNVEILNPNVQLPEVQEGTEILSNENTEMPLPDQTEGILTTCFSNKLLVVEQIVIPIQGNQETLENEISIENEREAERDIELGDIEEESNHLSIVTKPENIKKGEAIKDHLTFLQNEMDENFVELIDEQVEKEKKPYGPNVLPPNLIRPYEEGGRRRTFSEAVAPIPIVPQLPTILPFRPPPLPPLPPSPPASPSQVPLPPSPTLTPTPSQEETLTTLTAAAGPNSAALDDSRSGVKRSREGEEGPTSKFIKSKSLLGVRVAKRKHVQYAVDEASIRNKSLKLNDLLNIPESLKGDDDELELILDGYKKIPRPSWFPRIIKLIPFKYTRARTSLPLILWVLIANNNITKGSSKRENRTLVPSFKVPPATVLIKLLQQPSSTWWVNTTSMFGADTPWGNGVVGEISAEKPENDEDDWERIGSNIIWYPLIEQSGNIKYGYFEWWPEIAYIDGREELQKCIATMGVYTITKINQWNTIIKCDIPVTNLVSSEDAHQINCNYCANWWKHISYNSYREPNIRRERFIKYWENARESIEESNIQELEQYNYGTSYDDIVIDSNIREIKIEHIKSVKLVNAYNTPGYWKGKEDSVCMLIEKELTIDYSYKPDWKKTKWDFMKHNKIDEISEFASHYSNIAVSKHTLNRLRRNPHKTIISALVINLINEVLNVHRDNWENAKKSQLLKLDKLITYLDLEELNLNKEFMYTFMPGYYEMSEREQLEFDSRRAAYSIEHDIKKGLRRSTGGEESLQQVLMNMHEEEEYEHRIHSERFPP